MVHTILIVGLAYLPAMMVDSVLPGLFPIVVVGPVQPLGDDEALAGPFWRGGSRQRTAESRLSLPAEFLCLHILLPQVVRGLRVPETLSAGFQTGVGLLMRFLGLENLASAPHGPLRLLMAVVAAGSACVAAATAGLLVLGRSAVRAFDP